MQSIECCIQYLLKLVKKNKLKIILKNIFEKNKKSLKERMSSNKRRTIVQAL
jgi:flagellar motor switch protein FliG